MFFKLNRILKSVQGLDNRFNLLNYLQSLKKYKNRDFHSNVVEQFRNQNNHNHTRCDNFLPQVNWYQQTNWFWLIKTVSCIHMANSLKSDQSLIIKWDYVKDSTNICFVFLTILAGILYYIIAVYEAKNCFCSKIALPNTYSCESLDELIIK